VEDPERFYRSGEKLNGFFLRFLGYEFGVIDSGSTNIFEGA
jgi:hypothetical protein